MLRHPPSFRKGLFFLAIWIAWVAVGVFRAATHGPLVEALEALAHAKDPLFFAWIGGSAALLFLALMFLMRGVAGQARSRG